MTPTINSTANAAFTTRAQALNLHLRGVSLRTALYLADLERQPVQIIRRKPGQDNQRPTENGRLLAPCIAHKLASFDGEMYAVTDKGREYLARLRKGGLLQ